MGKVAAVRLAEQRRGSGVRAELERDDDHRQGRNRARPGDGEVRLFRAATAGEARRSDLYYTSKIRIHTKNRFKISWIKTKLL